MRAKKAKVQSVTHLKKKKSSIIKKNCGFLRTKFGLENPQKIIIDKKGSALLYRFRSFRRFCDLYIFNICACQSITTSDGHEACKKKKSLPQNFFV